MQNTEQTIRIGIVGAGSNTREKHIPGLQNIDGVKIVSVANRRRESSERVAREFSIPKVYDSWQDLVKAPDIDAVVIGTWPYLHCPVTIAALSEGKHVMCEARMAMNAKEATQMYEVAQQHPNLVAQVVPSPTTLQVDNTVKRLIGEGYLGQILAVEVHATDGAFLDVKAPIHWRQDFEFSGLNVMSLGIWYETLMRWIGEASSVTAKGKIFCTERHDPQTGFRKLIKIPDHLVVLAEMSCGALATFVLSTITGHKSTYEVTLFGSEGTLRFRNGVLSGVRRNEEDFSEIPIQPEELNGWRVEEEFVAAIRGTETIKYTTFENGMKYMDFTEAVARSLAEEKSISLPLR